MTTPLRVALIGYGLAGKVFHAPLIRATDGLTLACMVSSDAAKVHADIPGMAVSGDLGAVLADPAIDLVVIATPDHLHADHALAALDAGKHVVIDKPFAPRLDEARSIAAKAQACGKMLTIFHNRRWDGDFLTVKRLIADGTLGEVVQFESHFDRLRPVVQNRWKDRRDGGVWQDLGPHLIDQALVVLGMPDAVTADLAIQRSGGHAADYAHVTLHYPKARAILHASQSTHDGALRFAVHGTQGSFIKMGLDPQEQQSVQGLTPGDAAWGVDHQPGRLTRQDSDGAAHVSSVATHRGDYPAFYAAVRDAILGRGANPVPPEQALNVMAVLEAGLASAAQGRTIRLD